MAVAGALAPLAYLLLSLHLAVGVVTTGGLRALTNLLSAVQGQKALGPESFGVTTISTVAASRRLCYMIDIDKGMN